MVVVAPTSDLTLQTCTGTKIIDWSALASFSGFQLTVCAHELQSDSAAKYLPSTCAAAVNNSCKLQQRRQIHQDSLVVVELAFVW